MSKQAPSSDHLKTNYTINDQVIRTQNQLIPVELSTIHLPLAVINMKFHKDLEQYKQKQSYIEINCDYKDFEQ